MEPVMIKLRDLVCSRIKNTKNTLTVDRWRYSQDNYVAMFVTLYIPEILEFVPEKPKNATKVT